MEGDGDSADAICTPAIGHAERCDDVIGREFDHLRIALHTFKM